MDATTIERGDVLLGEPSSMIVFLYTADKDETLGLDVTTWLYTGSVDAGMYETVVDAFEGTLSRTFAMNAEDAAKNHDAAIAKYGVEGETEGDSCSIEHAAQYCVWRNLAYRPSFSLAGYEPWG